MIRYDKDVDVDRESPEDKALFLFSKNGDYDFLFEYGFSLFRCKINQKRTENIIKGKEFPLENSQLELSKVKKIIKVKLLCRAVPNMIKIYNKGSNENPSFYYVITSYSKHDPKGITFEMPGSKVGSHHSFSTALAKRVPFGFFEGSKGDYQNLLNKMIDHCHESGEIVEEASS